MASRNFYGIGCNRKVENARCERIGVMINRMCAFELNEKKDRSTAKQVVTNKSDRSKQQGDGKADERNLTNDNQELLPMLQTNISQRNILTARF